MKRTKQRVWAEGRAIAAQLPDESDAVVLEDHDFSTSDDEDRTPKGRATGDLLKGTSNAAQHAGSVSERFLRMGYQEDGRQASPERHRDMSDRDVLEKGLYIILISLHGLVRGDRMELGKDPDTGGQVQLCCVWLVCTHSDCPEILIHGTHSDWPCPLCLRVPSSVVCFIPCWSWLLCITNNVASVRLCTKVRQAVQKHLHQPALFVGFPALLQ